MGLLIEADSSNLMEDAIYSIIIFIIIDSLNVMVALKISLITILTKYFCQFHETTTLK